MLGDRINDPEENSYEWKTVYGCKPIVKGTSAVKQGERGTIGIVFCT